MTVHRVTATRLSLVPTLALASLVAVFAPLHAAAAQRGGGNGDARSLFTWTGSVDREVILTLDGNRLFVEGERARRGSRADRPGRNASIRTNNTLPRARGVVSVQRLDGRGSITVIEQPSARNGYVARIRVRDTRGGADRYRVRAFWQPVRPVVASRGRGNVVLVGDDARRGGRTDGRGALRGEGLRWSGVIDDVVDLHIRGQRVTAVVRSGAPTYAVRSTFVGNGLGRRDGGLRLLRADGRGRVAVIQQPGPWNGFTGIVRVHDRRGGAGRYALDIGW